MITIAPTNNSADQIDSENHKFEGKNLQVDRGSTEINQVIHIIIHFSSIMNRFLCLGI